MCCNYEAVAVQLSPQGMIATWKIWIPIRKVNVQDSHTATEYEQNPGDSWT